MSLLRFGHEIIKARKEMGLSQEALAEKAEISQMTLLKIEKGLSHRSMNTVKLAQILGIDIGILGAGVGLEGEPVGPQPFDPMPETVLCQMPLAEPDSEDVEMALSSEAVSDSFEDSSQPSV